MKFPRLAKWLCGVMERRVVDVREPDVYIGGADDPYLVRWHLIPRNRYFNVYLHEMHRSDDDRALHDHPWIWSSLILRGEYLERYPALDLNGRRELWWARWSAGSFRIRGAGFAHRLVMSVNTPEWARPLSLVITGPKVREWGFHCPRGWRHWRDFTDATGAKVGRGCD